MRFFYQSEPTAAAAADPKNLDDANALGGYNPSGARGAARLAESGEGSAMRAHLPPGFDSLDDNTGMYARCSRPVLTRGAGSRIVTSVGNRPTARRGILTPCGAGFEDGSLQRLTVASLVHHRLFAHVLVYFPRAEVPCLTRTVILSGLTYVSRERRRSVGHGSAPSLRRPGQRAERGHRPRRLRHAAADANRRGGCGGRRIVRRARCAAAARGEYAWCVLRHPPESPCHPLMCLLTKRSVCGF